MSNMGSPPCAPAQAPVAEEWVFRANMMPLLAPAFGASRAVVINPAFFGLGMNCAGKQRTQ